MIPFRNEAYDFNSDNFCSQYPFDCNEENQKKSKPSKSSFKSVQSWYFFP